jgi:hypothetical protein
MMHTTHTRGFATVAHLIIIVAALFGVGTIYLMRLPSTNINTDIPPQDEPREAIVVTDENFSDLFSSIVP